MKWDFYTHDIMRRKVDYRIPQICRHSLLLVVTDSLPHLPKLTKSPEAECVREGGRMMEMTPLHSFCLILLLLGRE